jgi:DNA-binding NarL/FixJ family response regulator
VPFILIYDPHPVTRYGMKQILLEECRGVVFGEASAPEDALRKAATRAWNLAILGLRTSSDESLQLLSELNRRHPALNILIFGSNRDADCGARALHLGARGYLSKEATRSQLMQAVNKVLAGKSYAGPAIRERLSNLRKRERRPRPKPLSSREEQVRKALVSGKRAGEIASSLSLSVKTVSTYKRRILDKVGVESIAELVRFDMDS